MKKGYRIWVVLGVLGILGIVSVALAHPPGSVELALDSENKTLSVRGTHSVQDVVAHRISKIQILVNGKQVGEYSYDRQMDRERYEANIPVDGLSQGDTLEAKVTCNKFGTKTATLKVAAAQEKGSEMDEKGLLALGSKAPAFRIKDHQGQDVSLESYAGKKNVVLIFYPKNNTPGCTKQLCAVRDEFSEFADSDTVVFGINPGSAQSHQQFVSKQKFPFPLLVDDQKRVARLYGADGVIMISRTVYGIDKEGKVVFAKRGMPSTQEILSSFEGKE